MTGSEGCREPQGFLLTSDVEFLEIPNVWHHQNTTQFWLKQVSFSKEWEDEMWILIIITSGFSEMWRRRLLGGSWLPPRAPGSGWSVGGSPAVDALPGSSHSANFVLLQTEIVKKWKKFKTHFLLLVLPSKIFQFLTLWKSKGSWKSFESEISTQETG